MKVRKKITFRVKDYGMKIYLLANKRKRHRIAEMYFDKINDLPTAKERKDFIDNHKYRYEEMFCWFWDLPFYVHEYQ